MTSALAAVVEMARPRYSLISSPAPTARTRRAFDPAPYSSTCPTPHPALLQDGTAVGAAHVAPVEIEKAAGYSGHRRLPCSQARVDLLFPLTPVPLCSR